MEEQLLARQASPHLRTWNPGSLQAEDARKWAAAISEMSTRMAIAQGHGHDSACQSAEAVMAGVSYAVDNSLTKKYHQCEPGCDSCCHVMIGVTTPEAMAIAKQLRKTYLPRKWRICVRSWLKPRRPRAGKTASSVSNRELPAACWTNRGSAVSIPRGLFAAVHGAHFPASNARIAFWSKALMPACPSIDPFMRSA